MGIDPGSPSAVVRRAARDTFSRHYRLSLASGSHHFGRLFRSAVFHEPIPAISMSMHAETGAHQRSRFRLPALTQYLNVILTFLSVPEKEWIALVCERPSNVRRLHLPAAPESLCLLSDAPGKTCEGCCRELETPLYPRSQRL